MNPNFEDYTNYYQKYIKYKQKYLELKGAGRTEDLIKQFKNAEACKIYGYSPNLLTVKIISNDFDPENKGQILTTNSKITNIEAVDKNLKIIYKENNEEKELKIPYFNSKTKKIEEKYPTFDNLEINIIKTKSGDKSKKGTEKITCTDILDNVKLNIYIRCDKEELNKLGNDLKNDLKLDIEYYKKKFNYYLKNKEKEQKEQELKNRQKTTFIPK